MSLKITLNYLLFGRPYNTLYFVEITTDANVTDLKSLIYPWIKPHLPDNFFPSDLVLFDVSLPEDECKGLGLGDFKDKVEGAIANKAPLAPLRQMRDIFKSSGSPPADCLHIIVQPPDDARNTIIENLRSRYELLFDFLQVRVLGFGSWLDDDVDYNLNGGKILAPGDTQLPDQLSEIEAKLDRIRTYARPADQDWWPGFRIASDPRHAQLFQSIYEEQDGPAVSVKDDQEFLAFSSILERFQNKSAKISSEKSSSLKASHFTVHFVVPPFLDRSAGFEYKEQTSLTFPIFMAERDEPELCCTFTPTPGFMVIPTSSICPFVTSEVISDPPKESDRRRMLLQAIAFARAGQHLVTAGKRFFVVAIYLRANMTAQRYVIAQTADNKIFMCQKDFNLCLPSDSILFLRQMYNLATELEELGGSFDPEKATSLQTINKLAGGLPSLSEMQRKKKPNYFTPGALGSMAEGNRGGAVDDPGVFGADVIQAILKEMEYKIKLIPLGYPLIAVVSSVADSSTTGFLKFVPDEQNEIQIIKYLSEIDSPRNHTVPGVRIWPVRGGRVISMFSAGTWLIHLKNPDAQLWSVAGQLFEAIDFMHRHGVAHLDLKPANILIPRDGGRLSIIDFNASIWIDDARTMFGGVVGTRGYIAPEAAAGRGLFSALRADLWSCGKTLSELCNLCRPSADRKMLLQVAQVLMDEDPEKRPMMSDVLAWMASCKVDGDAGMDVLKFIPLGPPEVSA